MPQTETNNTGDNASKWSDATSFPYMIDYNDHFETPKTAYEDILPLMDFVAPNKQGRAFHVLYDPYYCNGRTKRLLRDLGFSNVQHERRDFYQDAEQGKIPTHHTLVTNPPYSDQHKEKCIEFALKQLRDQGKPFFVLMPNYIASKDYYRRLLGSEQVSVDSMLNALGFDEMAIGTSKLANISFCLLFSMEVAEKLSISSPPIHTNTTIQTGLVTWCLRSHRFGIVGYQGKGRGK